MVLAEKTAHVRAMPSRGIAPHHGERRAETTQRPDTPRRTRAAWTWRTARRRGRY